MPYIDLSPHLLSGLRLFGECPFQGGTSSSLAVVNNVDNVLVGVGKVPVPPFI